MKRSTAWVSITLLVMFLSLLLIPISHATRSNRAASAINDRQRQDGLDLRRMAALNQPTLPRAQSETLKPISRQAVGFAVSDPVRELAAASRLETDPKEGGEDFEHEINELNAREVKSQRPESAKLPSLDASLQNLKPIESETPSLPSLTFDGLTAADNVPLIGGTVAPSDENLDVGPNDVVQTVNLAFRVYDKNGNPRIPPTLMSSLFSKLGGICANTDRGDPVVLYDRMADRWFITQFAFLGNGQAPPFHQCVAVSQNGDPTGVYYAYDFVTPGAEFPDYGKFGVWPDGYYMTVNQFTEPGDHFNGVGMYALDRQKMLIGDPTASFIYFNLNLTVHPEGVNSTQPSDQDGLEAPPPGTPNTFAYLISDEFEIAPFNVDALKLYDFHADFTTPANSTFIERPESPVPVAAFDPRTVPATNRDIKQPAPATTTDALDSIEYHLMFRLQYRNRGGIETLVSSTTVNVSGLAPTTLANFQAGVRYFQLQRSTPGGPWLLYDNATFSPDAGTPATGVNRWLPSAAIDHMGNLAVSYSASSTSVFPSIWYAGRDFNALGGLTGEQHMFDGTAVQLGSSNRWGDYQSLQVDPTDDCTFWTTNQYYNVNSQFNWRTRIGRFKFPTCAAPPQGTVSGTVTACDSGVPLGGAIVQLSNGFSTTTKADGTYSFNVAPGTYTATVSANINRDCTPSTSSVVTVSDGNTTTFNVCLNGVAKPVVDTTNPSAVVISGGNGNAIIDPNECNSLTVRLDNTGCAPARNVTTTLSTSTPGVTITQSHSPYADIPIDGNGNNLVPYSVSTDPGFVCGTPIQFTLTVTFTGGTTVSTFSIPTCNETQPPQTVNGSLDPADPDTTAGRLFRNGVTKTCAAPKACPGALGSGGRSFDTLSFPNTGPLDSCATITLASAGGLSLIGAAYLDTYNPADTTFCNNYLGDPGGSNTSVTWQATIPTGHTLVVVVMEVNAGTAATPYSVTVSGLSAPAPAGGGVCATCAITAPANITVPNDTNQCGAVVNFPAPVTTGTCGIVSVSPASGSFFPVGTTTVNITSTAGTTASFTVTVNDTQPPTITCPANIVAQTAPNATSAVVNFAATGSDNCPSAVLSYNPPSGSTFPLGTTIVTATNTDGSGNTATCTFNVTVNQPQTIQFNAAALNVPESGSGVNLIVTRTGGSVGAATVEYATSDGTATQKTDYTIKLGTLHFADGETSKILQVPIVNDVFVEGDETFTVALSNVTGTGVSLGSSSSATVTIMDDDLSAPTSNPIDGTEFFVRQHYLDFLNRVPDNDGLNFWVDSINSCGTDSTCTATKRVITSGAFFLSIEFQDTGVFFIRTQRVAFGRKSDTPGTRVTFLELIRAQSQIGDGVVIGQPGAAAKLEANKQAYILQVVNSSAFLTLYGSLTAVQYVDALYASAGVTPTPTERSDAITAFGGGGPSGRAAALRLIVDSNSVGTAEFNASFVLMQYLGYLRRNPTDPPDNNDVGYQFWLAKLNAFNGDFLSADMVKAFILSAEYRQRFGP